MDRRMREALDRHITGNYGEDQFKGTEDDTEFLKKEAEFFKKMEMEEKEMTYAEMFRKAKEEGKTRDISFTIFKFETVGDTLIGELVGFETISIPKPGSTTGEKSEVLQYRILTDEGPVSTVLGYSGDKSIHDNDIRNGDILVITYTGKKDLDAGRRVNLYNIECVKRDR